jgi:uncharacterized YigZ family protein
MYKTIAQTGEFEQVINKSTFIASAVHVESEAEAQEFIQKEKKKYPDARHCCWAYVLGAKKDAMRYADDGEPQGTAGQPILQVIEKKDITNVLVTVTRYFGGILLGAGGLTRAYSSSAAGAIDATGIKTMIMSQRFLVKIDYTTFARLEKALRASDYIITDSIDYLENVILHLTVKEEDSLKLTDYFTQATAGKAQITEDEKLYLPW